MKKFVVYTVIVGNYDEVKQPLVIDDRFDYVLFSDTHFEKNIGVWQIHTIPYTSDKTYVKARFPRLQPQKVLPNYEAWLYHDGTIQISSLRVYERCVDLYNNGIEWAGIKHQWRNNIYQEMEAILWESWVHDYEVLEWCEILKSQNYPSPLDITDSYLYETGIIFRMNTPNVCKVNDLWWWSVENYVRRDQFSIMFALWKVPNIKVDFLLSSRENVWRNDGHFTYNESIPHKRKLSLSLYERIRLGCWKVGNTESEPYINFLYRFAGYKRPLFAMNLWTLYAMFRYGINVIIKHVKNNIKSRYYG